MTIQIRPRFTPAVRGSKTARGAVWAFIAFQAALGGASGVLIGALLLNWMSPGHPFFLEIQAGLRNLLGM